LLLTLAEAEFFRLRWSATILDETQKGIEEILADKDVADAAERASRARASMDPGCVQWGPSGKSVATGSPIGAAEHLAA